ncbi:MAG: hypothetical protein NZ571_10830, partial [Anaerolineae bacterium]|nr:hypothetical protein [Anaerolineae bacterium]
MQDLHAEIRTAIALNNLDRARDLLRQALRGEPDAETYYLASQVAISDEQKREFLRKALELDPFHAGAQYALERLKLLSRASAAPSEVSYSYSEPMAPLYKPKPAED